MKKDDIEKIDEQIQSIKDTEKRIKNKKEKNEEIIEDVISTDTKKVDTIDEIKIDDEEKTKELNTIENIEEPVDKKEEVLENKENKKISRPILFSIIGVVLVFIIIAIFLLIPSGNNKKSVKTNKNKVLSKGEQKQAIKGYGDALKGIIAVYYENQNVLLKYDDATKLVNYKYKVECRVHEVYEDGKLYLNKCSINGKKTSFSYGKKQEKEEAKISEDAIKVYVSKKTKKAVLKEPNNVKSVYLPSISK